MLSLGVSWSLSRSDGDCHFVWPLVTGIVSRLTWQYCLAYWSALVWGLAKPSRLVTKSVTGQSDNTYMVACLVGGFSTASFLLPF